MFKCSLCEKIFDNQKELDYHDCSFITGKPEGGDNLINWPFLVILKRFFYVILFSLVLVFFICLAAILYPNHSGQIIAFTILVPFGPLMLAIGIYGFLKPEILEGLPGDMKKPGAYIGTGIPFTIFLFCYIYSFL